MIQGIICCLLGNKLDNDGNREILKEEGEEYSKEIEFDFFEEISAKMEIILLKFLKKLEKKYINMRKFLKLKIHMLQVK